MLKGLQSDAGGYKIALVSPETGLSYTSTTLKDPGIVGNRLRTVLNKVIEEEAHLPSRLEENRNMMAALPDHARGVAAGGRSETA